MRSLPVFLVHIETGAVHGRNDFIKRNLPGCIEEAGQIDRAQGTHGSHRISFNAGDLDQSVYRVTGKAQIVFHGNFCGVFDLVDIEAVKRCNSGSRHRAGAPDFRLASAFCSGYARIGADNISDQSGNRQGIEYLLLRKASVVLHVIQDGREDSAASAGRCRDDHFFRRILFADRVGIGRNQPVHGHIRAFIVASLFVQRLSLPKHAQAPGQGSFRFQPAFDRTAHGLPDLPQILAERRSF